MFIRFLYQKRSPILKKTSTNFGDKIIVTNDKYLINNFLTLFSGLTLKVEI